MKSSDRIGAGLRTGFPLVGVLVAVAIAGATASLLAASSRVAINEIMYHPPDDREDLQWVELHNPGPEPVALEGWEFVRGIRFRFESADRLPPGGFLVLARDRQAFAAHYGTEIPVVGDFSGRLSHSGEALELADSQGRSIDVVRYDDAEPWPVSPDGLSASLERIAVDGPGDDPANWAPSPLPEFREAAGTPGRPNVSFRTNLPPIVRDVVFSPPAPGEPMRIAALVSDPDGVREVRLAFRSLSHAHTFRGSESPPEGWEELAMPIESGTDRAGTYAAILPPQPDGRLVRFRIAALDEAGGLRLHPHPDDARPTYSVYVGANTHTAQIPVAHILEFGPPERAGESLHNPHRPGRRNSSATSVSAEPTRGDSALVLMPVKGGPIEVFDHIRITPRKGGRKVRLHKDRPCDGMTTVNVLFEGSPRYLLSEHLGYEVFRAAGVPAPRSGHWRVWHNERPLGYHLTVEQPNNSFLRRHGRDTEGDVFKLLWYGQGAVGQHEKKNNPDSGHTALTDTLATLAGTPTAGQWDLIRRRFDVDIFAGYFAVNMCLQNWDGFFNNYFLYRSPGADGRWEIYPWDLDKTWGDYDGASPKYDWYSMPLTIGMGGDRPPRSVARFFGGGGPFGGTSWWRPPGWFSGPLLAQPDFRAHFRNRLRELCETVFTPEGLEVPIARLERRLEPEVRFRASLFGSEAEFLAEFHGHIDSFRRQVRHRRDFILKELPRDR